MAEKQVKKKSVIKTIITVIEVLIVVVASIALLIMLISRLTGNEPELFGYKIFYVQTGSMSPTIEAGDAILTKDFKVGDELNVDDIITYAGAGEMSGATITHRVKTIEGEVGSRTVVTRGDANNADDKPFTEDRIVAKCVTKLSLLGKMLTFMRSKTGFMVVLAVIAIFVVYTVINGVLNVKAAENEDEKKKAVEEAIIAEAMKKKAEEAELAAAQRNTAEAEKASKDEEKKH